MLTLKEMTEFFEKRVPKEKAEDWDNVGLLIGDMNAEIHKALFALDVDEGVVSEAVEHGAQVIFCHHPVFFSGTKRITADTAEGRMCIAAVKNDIAVYAAHTNLDCVTGGINDLLAEMLGLTNVKSLVKEFEGLGRIGDLPESVMLREFAANIRDIFGSNCVRFFGKPDLKINKVALSSGGGAGYLNDAVGAGADCFIAGDFKYNAVRGSVIPVIDLPHYDSEKFAAPLLADIFKNQFGKKILYEISVANKNIYSIV